ncbi:MAG: helicase, partial [Planctomycetota bacterium]
TLWSAGYIELDPKPKPKAPNAVASKKKSDAQPETGGLFGHILDEMKSESGAGDEASDEEDDAEAIQSRGYEVDDYRPDLATPTDRLSRLVHLRSINPLYGVYLADQLAIADPTERIATLESVLEVPGTVARLTRMPKIEDMPPGTLATSRLDPLLLQAGLATAEELGASSGDDEEKVEDRGFGRVMFDEPRVWPLTIGEKLHRVFQHEFPRVDDVRVRPVWIVGELLEFGGDFNKYVTSRKLQKEEGILFRQCLRMILLLDEMANVPPVETTVEDWEDWLDGLADQLTETCKRIDPQSTDEILSPGEPRLDELVEPGRRN